MFFYHYSGRQIKSIRIQFTHICWATPFTTTMHMAYMTRHRTQSNRRNSLAYTNRI